MTQVESISQNGSIDLIDGINSQSDEFEKVIVNSEYLAEITEDTMYQIYRTAVQVNHSKGFEDFQQHHRDAYLRLKLRDLHYSELVIPASESCQTEQEETKEENPIYNQFDRKVKLVQGFHVYFELTLKEAKAAIETLKQAQTSQSESFQILLNEKISN